MQISDKISRKIPDLVPSICKYHLKLMPNWLKVKIIGQALNHFFQESIEEGDLDFLEGKTFKINVEDLDYAVTITLKEGKLKVLDNYVPADAALKSTFNPLILMISRREDPDTLFFNRTLALEGNTVLGLEIKNWLDSLDLDLLPKAMQSTLQRYSQMI